MKTLRLLLTCCFLFLSADWVFSQDKTKPGDTNINSELFNRGMNSYTLRQNFSYIRPKYLADDGQELFHTNTLGIDAEWNYWFKKGLGAGLNLNYASSGTHYPANDQLIRSWSINPTFSYGTELSKDLNAYLRAGLIFGGTNQIYKTSGTTNENKGDQFGYNFRGAVPWEISKQTAVVPELYYEHTRTKYDDGKGIDNGYGLSVHLEDYLPCGGMKCDHSQGYRLSLNAYDKGSSTLNYNSDFGVNIGKSTVTYNSVPGSYITKYNNINFDGAYSNYVIDNLAVGGRIGFLSMVQKSDDNAFRYNWTNFNVEPEVTLNAPVSNGFRNTFIRVGGILSTQKFEFKTGGTTNTDNYTNTGFQLGVGYNTFMTDQSAIQLYGGYRSYVEKEKDSDNKTKIRGLVVSLGVIHSFK